MPVAVHTGRTLVDLSKPQRLLGNVWVGPELYLTKDIYENSVYLDSSNRYQVSFTSGKKYGLRGDKEDEKEV